jgi:alkanesulfonate monooxygenase SsuD/methylene tetrahydromethanopterin reductase-like flavin-dependent oxidoreductase (luciferase family)
MEFKPTRPPPGRLARLGVVVDTGDGPARLLEIARMCDGAGIDAIWLSKVRASDDEPRMDAWSALALVGAEVHRPRLGMMGQSVRSPKTLAARVRGLDSANGGRLELGIGGAARARRLRRHVQQLRELLGEATPTISISAGTPDQLVVAARLADDVQLMAPSGDPKSISEDVRAACDRADRDPTSLGVAVFVPVSIGRTTAEAQARMDAEPSAWGFLVRKIGIFGTLEQCQERVIDLAHAGVTDLRCLIPNAPDIHDVIAQLTAIAVGTVDVLAPGVPRSKAPDPPAGWGGRTNPA